MIPDQLRARVDRDFRRVVISPRAIVHWQFLFVVTVALPFFATIAVRPDFTESTTLLVGVLIIIGATTVAGLFPWRQSNSRWALLLAIVDVPGVLLLYIPTPGAGFSMLVVLPVVWVAIAFGGLVATLMVASSIVALWAAWWAQAQVTEVQLIGGIPATAAVTSLIVLSAVAAYQTNRVASARRGLLHRQSDAFSRALERASLQERFTSSVLDSLDLAVFSFDADGGLRTANRSAWLLLRHLGGTRFEAALSDYEIDYGSPIFAPDGPIGRALQGEQVDGETTWVGGAQPIAIEWTSQFLRGDDGSTENVIVLARDVTSQLRAQADRDELVTSVSHEFRTPLTSILGYLELALDEPGVPAVPREMVEVALKNTERLLTLSNDFLAARSPSGRSGMVLTMEPCRPSAIVEDAITAVRPQAIARSIAIVVGPLPDIVLEADPLRIRQVIDNVLTNAVKYNVESGRIFVDAVLTDTGHYALSIRDTGRGMSAHDAERVFDRGYRSAAARDSAVGGSGLGLDISRQIIESHTGTMALSSVPGEGTTVSITLPTGAPDGRHT